MDEIKVQFMEIKMAESIWQITRLLQKMNNYKFPYCKIKKYLFSFDSIFIFPSSLIRIKVLEKFYLILSDQFKCIMMLYS